MAANTRDKKPQRVLVPLTDEVIIAAGELIDNENAFSAGFWQGARFAERAHGVTGDVGTAHTDSTELQRLCDELKAENAKLRHSKRALFQAGRDSYLTSCSPMNSDDEAWADYLRSNGIKISD